jgi:hypothetical protein
LENVEEEVDELGDDEFGFGLFDRKTREVPTIDTNLPVRGLVRDVTSSLEEELGKFESDILAIVEDVEEKVIDLQEDHAGVPLRLKDRSASPASNTIQKELGMRDADPDALTRAADGEARHEKGLEQQPSPQSQLLDTTRNDIREKLVLDPAVESRSDIESSAMQKRATMSCWSVTCVLC